MSRFRAPDGTELAYDDRGEGPAILCLSGLTRTMGDFDYVLPTLAGCRVIRMDYRGRGASDWADPATYTVPVEAGDALALLDRLGVERAAILGTSRGGLIAMGLARVAKDRLTGVCLNDIGPELAPGGLEAIRGYVGINPPERTLAEAVATRADRLPGFVGVPPERWALETERSYRETADGLVIRYDPRLRDAVLAPPKGTPPDPWALFDGMEGLPLALIRGTNSNLLTPATAAKMRERRPDMIFAEVPDRGHVPFLDEPEAVAAILEWVEMLP